MNVVFFKPKMPERQNNSLNSSLGDIQGQYNSTNSSLGDIEGQYKSTDSSLGDTHGQYNSTNSSFGDTAIPGIEVGFYIDLSARAIDAVESMKK